MIHGFPVAAGNDAVGPGMTQLPVILAQAGIQASPKACRSFWIRFGDTGFAGAWKKNRQRSASRPEAYTSHPATRALRESV